MNRLIRLLSIQVIILINSSSFSLAQDESLNGTYVFSTSHPATIEDGKMTITLSAYEFYGQPNTVYRYTYNVHKLDNENTKVTLRKSKIIAGPKKIPGSMRVYPAWRRPMNDGIYRLTRTDNGNIEWVNLETKREVTMTKIVPKTG